VGSGEQDNNAFRQGRPDLFALEAWIREFIRQRSRLEAKGVKVPLSPDLLGALRGRVHETEPDNSIAADAVQELAYRELNKAGALPSPS